ncbi:MAG: L-aspartate oxidase [Planctomycetia bacterium]|nr:L-aspartate oxidase [Planctomycetia bacterium]
MSAFSVARYLVPFHPKRVPHQFADVLVIGGGIAGFRAALEIDSRLSVVVITKEGVQQSSSNAAQGGIAGVLGPEDRFENHVEDTLRAGGALCHRDVVEMVVREAPDRIRELMAWGANFDRELAGELALGREGGHSHHRIVHALGDATGREVMRVLIERGRQAANVEIWSDTLILDLLTHEGRCRGALAWNAARGKTLVWAKQTILCTGGAGQIYRESTNPSVATGDGLAMAYRAGAELRDMEFMQFHPTVLYIAGSGRQLITEAVRGEGAHLVDRNGHRFMPDYDPRAELAPRDVVSEAIVRQMEKTKSPCVFLDLSHLDPERVRQRFPGFVAVCKEFNLDVTKDRIPVRPGAHYMLGGVSVDPAGRTSVPALWAAGEVTSSGLHGANRLASNSLLEGLVFGKSAGAGASAQALRLADDFRGLALENPAREDSHEPLDLADIRNSLTSLMWRCAGVHRNKISLKEALATIDQWCEYVLFRQFSEAPGWQLQNMLTVARLMIDAALHREESRGVHRRTDFPNTDDAHWLKHIVFRREPDAL